jgi:hypothetical protein
MFKFDEMECAFEASDKKLDDATKPFIVFWYRAANHIKPDSPLAGKIIYSEWTMVPHCPQKSAQIRRMPCWDFSYKSYLSHASRVS